MHDQRLTEVLNAYTFAAPVVTPIPMGNINTTYGVETLGSRYILQRLNPIFKAEIHLDIQAITEHLEQRGMPTPRLICTRTGALWTTDSAGSVWRAFTHVPGVVHDHAPGPALCQAAGLLVGRFHRAVDGLAYTFKAARSGVHDTARHLRNLEDALRQHPQHPAFPQVEPVGQAILAAAAALPDLTGLPERIVHGDLKLNNIIFSATGEGVCLIDLDTLNRMSLAVELGDAFRSWCNPGGEDAAAARFDMDFFAAGIRGYAAGVDGAVSAVEIDSIIPGVETIPLELAARFAADALQERYFGWNRQRYGAAWEHHLVRAKSQLSLAQSFATQRDEARRLVEQAFARVGAPQAQSAV